MATSLNSGFKNNVNNIQLRTSGTSMQRVTDRPIDIDGDGDKETVSIVVTSGYAGSGNKKISQTITKPAGIARSIVEQTMETDGGVNKDTDVSEFTAGI